MISKATAAWTLDAVGGIASVSGAPKLGGEGGAMSDTERTLVDRITSRLKNNPVIAMIIVVGIAIGALGTFWKSLPENWTSVVTGVISTKPVDNGWLFLGYQNHNSRVYWSEGPYADLVSTLDSDPIDPFPIGSRIRLNHKRELIIVDYGKTGAKLAYVSPPSVHGILSHADRTGAILEPGLELTVRDVWIGSFPGHDLAVWVRAVPAGTAD